MHRNKPNLEDCSGATLRASKHTSHPASHASETTATLEVKHCANNRFTQGVQRAHDIILEQYNKQGPLHAVISTFACTRPQKYRTCNPMTHTLTCMPACARCKAVTMPLMPAPMTTAVPLPTSACAADAAGKVRKCLFCRLHGLMLGACCCRAHPL